MVYVPEGYVEIVDFPGYYVNEEGDVISTKRNSIRHMKKWPNENGSESVYMVNVAGKFTCRGINKLVKDHFGHALPKFKDSWSSVVYKVINGEEITYNTLAEMARFNGWSLPSVRYHFKTHQATPNGDQIEIIHAY